MARVSTTFAAILVVALLGACGGGSDKSDADKGPTQARVIAEADALCASAQKRVSALPAPDVVRNQTAPTAADLPGLAGYFDEVAAIQSETVAALRKIPAPARDRKTLASIFDTVQTGIDALKATSVAAREADLTTFQLRYNDAVQANAKAALPAARYGFNVCGQQ
jgi:hypothetical protein